MSDVLPVSSEHKNIVIAVSSEYMGTGDGELGALLLDNFFFALTQQEDLPQTILLYNAAVKLACSGSRCAKHLEALAQQGVRIASCGTCLQFYGLTDQLIVGEVGNMYSIVETQMNADVVIRP